MCRAPGRTRCGLCRRDPLRSAAEKQRERAEWRRAQREWQRHVREFEAYTTDCEAALRRPRARPCPCPFALRRGDGGYVAVEDVVPCAGPSAGEAEPTSASAT